MSEQIHYNDAKVEYRTDIKGWIGSDGRYYGDDEHLARWYSCTHVKCSNDGCENQALRSQLRCESCKEKSSIEKWRNAEKRKPLNTDVIYWSDACSEYFQSFEEINEYAYENDLSVIDMRLYHCEQESGFPQVDIHDLYEEYSTEEISPDEYVSPEICEAIENLNKLLKKQEILVWHPSNIAVDVE